MKKILGFLFLFASLISCNNDSGVTNFNETNNMKPSELFVYSNNTQLNITRAIDWHSEIGYSIPDNDRYLVYYFIRIDGNIPGEIEANHLSKQYFPQTSAGKTVISDLNRGYVTANVNWKSCSLFNKYVYSTDGLVVQSIIEEEPTLEDLFNADNSKYDLTGYIANQDKLHFLWYVCKQQNQSDHTWHIDGVLTTKEKTNISETEYGESQIDDYNKKGIIEDTLPVIRKANIEVDVHQQEHKDWNEIKTSIHLRDTVDVEVFIPIQYQEQADDFNIRVGKEFEYITEIKDTKIQIAGNEYQLEASITHEENGIRIIIKPNKDALIAARKEYMDGITYEIHNYVNKGVSISDIWNYVKGTTCKTTPYTLIQGQITSAYFNDKIEF